MAIGDYLPKIKDITISVIARDGKDLAPDNRIRCLKSLRTLTFTSSLLNRKRSGFNTQDAARFISALISPETTFTMQELDLEGFGPDEPWLSFMTDYNKFAEELEGRVAEYMEVRKGEASR